VTRIRNLLPLAGVLVGAAVPAVLLLVAGGTHMVMFVPAVHIIVVGVAGTIAGVAAVTMSVVAARRNDGRALWIGMSFSVSSIFLLIHALATPGVFLPDNDVVEIAGGLNIPITGMLLAASALPALRRPRRVRLLLRIELTVVAALLLVGALALIFYRLAPEAPYAGSPAADLVFALGSIPLLVVALRAARTYFLTRRLPDLVVAAGAVWLIAAEYGLLNYSMMDAAWWAAHVLEMSGIGMVGIPAAIDLKHAVASRALVGDLRAGHLVEHEEAFLGGRVRALLVRLGEKDPSTEGHTRRVATFAVAIGERLGLPESRLRQLALGGLLHDIGKLSVPNHILNKPGRLTDEEFAEIRRHPGAGRELLTELGGFTPLVLELVESHHERLDAGGYPNGVSAGELDLAVRILTVADVYDALTADRVYREAWPVERALALLEEETGSAFDAECVSALRAIVAPAAGAAAAPAAPAAVAVRGRQAVAA
jgi:HD-GYP domain-containing protein (c-di-GMP phosphodiesterase class II)